MRILVVTFECGPTITYVAATKKKLFTRLAEASRCGPVEQWHYHDGSGWADSKTNETRPPTDVSHNNAVIIL